jgi:hypothetical protein
VGDGGQAGQVGGRQQGPDHQGRCEPGLDMGASSGSMGEVGRLVSWPARAGG